MKLKKIVRFSPGINPSRVEQEELDKYVFYDKESFEKDFEFEKSGGSNYKKSEESLLEGDLVFYSISNQIAIVSTDNEGKIPSLNFSKVEMISDKIDKNYFMYMFNEDDIVKRQIERESQGLQILKLSLSSLYEIDIPIIPKEEQGKIGKIYIESLKLKSKIIKYSELLELVTMQLLSMKVREKYDNGKNRKK